MSVKISSGANRHTGARFDNRLPNEWRGTGWVDDDHTISVGAFLDSIILILILFALLYFFMP